VTRVVIDDGLSSHALHIILIALFVVLSYSTARLTVYSCTPVVIRNGEQAWQVLETDQIGAWEWQVSLD
jgi:hypothetical protein